tara:strand:+ start:544 stop:663 length:120 start_codon:yes stop_codon:yes gene_type:complete
MTDSKKDKEKRDEVLKRMLSTPPKPKKKEDDESKDKDRD